MTRHCVRCRLVIPPGEAVILGGDEAGSGAPVARYAHRDCAPDAAEQQTPRISLSPPPAGFRR